MTDQDRAIASSGSCGSSILAALNSLAEVDGAKIYRRELLGEMRRALKEKCANPELTLRRAAWIVRERTRHMGRLLPRFAMGRTLLVKGLEFDHAIVLDADNLDAKNLYVAITRGAKSLTILSKRRLINPRPSKDRPAAPRADR